MKRKEKKRKQTKENKTKRNETIRNKTKQNSIMSLRIVLNDVKYLSIKLKIFETFNNLNLIKTSQYTTS